MPKEPAFSVYDASAGSGKTFTLVKEYLKILFASNNKDQFKHILAITFTNKAVGEMKERILDTLRQFSNPKILQTPNSIFNAICEESPILPEQLHIKSKGILNTIMHNYAAFDISTIDGFNHRLIRTFAHDLKLPLNFEVELDTISLLNEAVDSLIAKAGTDKSLTKTLVDFALQKADEDKSWDVSRDFNAIAKLLINENDIEFVKTLENKSLDDFKDLKKNLRDQIDTAEKEVKEKSQSVLDLIERNGMEFSDFSRRTLPNHFKKASELNLNGIYSNQLEKNISEGKVYNKTLDSAKANAIDAILPQIETLYHATKSAVFHFKFLKAFYKNLTPLSVLNAINNELNTIKVEQNKMLISEFNSILSNEIKNQPTPFIYERLGEKFRHYFIDEFQDTSQMQWENLIPLTESAITGQNLKGERGSAMLVGDAKQAIYRWRGGKAEQFIGLCNNSNPFQTEKNVIHLPANYRSFENIVNFNNSFFSYVSTAAFGSSDYENLYKNAKQDVSIKDKGYVNLTFIDFEKDDDKDVIYPEYVLENINECIRNGYNLKDICILVRKKKEGIAIAEFLNNESIKITSSETMLISNSPEVNMINNVLTLLINPNNKESKIYILEYLANTYNIKDKHHFFKSHIALELSEFFKSFEEFGIFANPKTLLQLALYDLAETIVRDFKLTTNSNAYIQFYLDAVLEYSQKHISDATGFLEYFEKKKEVLSIVSPQNQDAVQIMTIHKSKGLEFPVVIFPYAQLDIYKEIDPQEWYPIDKEKYNGFTHTLLNYSKDYEFYDAVGAEIHERHQAELELDSLNLLYVALTRPVEQLYIIAKKDISAKGIVNSKTYSGLLINYLMQNGEWKDSQLTYSYGVPKRENPTKPEPSNTIEQTAFISTAKEDHNIKVIANSGYLWDTEQQDAIEKGNLIHDIMAQIKTEKDIDNVISSFVTSAIINEEQARLLSFKIKQIVTFSELKNYFNNAHTIYNERDIITKSGTILRPDRLVINKHNQVVIIDYKTGLQNPKYQHQLQDYQDVLEDMQFQVINKILIFINDDIKIQSFK